VQEDTNKAREQNAQGNTDKLQTPQGDPGEAEDLLKTISLIQYGYHIPVQFIAY
jgi:hypothetical protein